MGSNAEFGESHATDWGRILVTKISRRGALKVGALALTASMAAGACNVPGGALGSARPESAPPTPILTPGETEPVQPEILTGDTFTKAFIGFNDATEVKIPNASGTITKSGKDLVSYASEVWNDNININTIFFNSRHAFELALASANMTGTEGTIDMSQIFPELSLKLSRLNLSALPNDNDSETATDVFPKNLVLRKGMNMIVVGVDDSTKEAIVAFEDTLRKPDKTPTMYLSALPLELQGEEDGQISLNELLARNGASYDDRTHSILYENGETLPLNSLDSALSINLHQTAGAYFLDLDPLRKNKDGSPAYTVDPVIPTPDVGLVPDGSKIEQLKDGRIGAVDANGKLAARARYSFAQNDWKWVTDKESLQDFTIREYADAIGMTFSVFTDKSLFGNPNYDSTIETVGNEISIAAELDAPRVFSNFTSDDWENILSNWSTIEASLKKGVVPEGFNYSWKDADAVIAYAQNMNMPLEAQYLFWDGGNVPDSILNGNYSNVELAKLVEFMIKTRVLQYKGVINEWGVVAEVSAILSYAKPSFLVEKLGRGIIDDAYIWAHEANPDAKLRFTDDHVLETDDPNLVNGYFTLLKHFKQANIPVDIACIENNMWIYTPPNKKHMVDTLKRIKSMGYKIVAGETTVVTGDVWPIWPQRPKAVKVTDKLQAQAKIYRDIADAYLQAGGSGFGIGGFTDSSEWYDVLGHPEADAMIFDKAYQPKPAYFALVNSLKSYLATKS